MSLPLTEKQIGVTIVLIPYNNEERFLTRLERELLPTLQAHPHWDFQVIIVDNSDEDKRPSYRFFEQHQLKHKIFWPGTNLMYGPAMNLALTACENPYVVYMCSNHGRMYDPTWIDDLLLPLVNDERVAMTGSYYGSCNPDSLGFPSHLPRYHIQGGLFAARTATLQAYPYTTNQSWIHGASDIYQSFQLLNAGFTLRDVPTVKSVWRQNLDSPERWKYVHDYVEGQ
jgi:hypothetical protein